MCGANASLANGNGGKVCSMEFPFLWCVEIKAVFKNLYWNSFVETVVFITATFR
jgi:hypothetical protein